MNFRAPFEVQPRTNRTAYTPGSSIACLASRGIVEIAQVTGELVDNLHSSRRVEGVHTTDIGEKVICPTSRRKLLMTLMSN